MKSSPGSPVSTQITSLGMANYCRGKSVVLRQPSHQIDNIQDGIRDIEKALNIDDKGDSNTNGATTGASEQNKDLLDRLDKIKSLWASVGPWTNPLPAEWA